MGKLVINHNLINDETAKTLIDICPFGAISYENGKLDISSACKMCKMCVKKGGGTITFEEEVKVSVDKSEWKGICVYADHAGGKIHRVTYELCGKALELAKVTGHPVYALMIGKDISACAEKLLHYGVNKVFVYDNEAYKDFKIEPFTAAFRKNKAFIGTCGSDKPWQTACSACGGKVQGRAYGGLYST